MFDPVAVHFSRASAGGGVLVVATVGAQAYGAIDADPMAALHAAAAQAAADLLDRGHTIAVEHIIGHGHDEWRAGAFAKFR